MTHLVYTYRRVRQARGNIRVCAHTSIRCENARSMPYFIQSIQFKIIMCSSIQSTLYRVRHTQSSASKCFWWNRRKFRHAAPKCKWRSVHIGAIFWSQRRNCDTRPLPTATQPPVKSLLLTYLCYRIESTTRITLGNLTENVCCGHVQWWNPINFPACNLCAVHISSFRNQHARAHMDA